MVAAYFVVCVYNAELTFSGATRMKTETVYLLFYVGE